MRTQKPCFGSIADLEARADTLLVAFKWLNLSKDKDVIREKQRGGVENSGEGKTYHRTPPQKRFWPPPPTMIRFPPSRLFTPCDLLWRKRAQTRQIPLSEASKSGFWRGHSTVRSPPQNRTIRFAPPLAISQDCTPLLKISCSSQTWAL